MFLWSNGLMVRGPRGSFKAPGMGQADHENKSALKIRSETFSKP